MRDVIQTRKEIGKILTKRQKELKFSLYKLVKDSGLQYKQVRGILSGETSYSIDSFLLLTDSLLISAEEIVRELNKDVKTV